MHILLIFLTLLICLDCCYGHENTPLYLGCFSINCTTHCTTRYITAFSADKCFQVCTSLKKPYAGLDSVHLWCHCPDNLGGFHPNQEDNSQCFPCQEDSIRMCGSDVNSVSIYKLNSTVLTGRVDVKFLLVNKNRIELLNTSRDDSTLLAESGNKHPIAVDYHYVRDEAYAIWNDSLYRFSLGSKKRVYSKESPEEVINCIGCRTFAVDWVHNHLILPHHHSIDITDLYGRNQHKLITLSKNHPPEIFDIDVDPYKGLLFWLAQNSLRRCGLDGRNIKTLVQPLPTQEVISMTLDMVTEKIYFAGIVDGSARVFYTTYNGSKCQTLKVFPHYGERILSIGVLRSVIYFLISVPNARSYLVQTSVFINDSTITELLVYQQHLSNMKLVHLELQSPPAVYACTHRGCSHHCVVENSLARCRCPHGFKVGSDDKTCEDILQSVDLVHVMFGGLISVVFVVLAAAVLIAMCDKLWSHVHLNTVWVRVKKAFTRPEPYYVIEFTKFK